MITQVIELILGIKLVYFASKTRSLHIYFEPITTPKEMMHLLWVICAATSLTHPFLWFVAPSLAVSYGYSYHTYLLGGEIAVITIEALWYSVMLIKPSSGSLHVTMSIAIIYSLVLNVASWSIGHGLRILGMLD